MAGSTLRSLIISLQARTDQFEKGMKDAQRELRDLRTATQQTQSVIGNMGDSLLAAGKGAAGALIGFQALKSGIEGVVQAGLRMERLQASFKAVAGGAEAGRKEFAFVSETANRLGQNIETLAQGYNLLAAASKGTSLEGQKTKDIFLAITQAGRSLQLSQEQVQGALQAVGQMISKGTVQAEELRGQLGERLPGAFQIAARAMGVSTQELSKMLEQGQVISEEFLPRLAAQIRRELGQNTEEVTRTAGENFARFGNAMLTVADNVAKNTGLLEWLGKVAGKVADIALEGDKASKRLDEIAKKRAGEIITQQTGGAGANTPEEKRRAAQLETLERQIIEADNSLTKLRQARDREQDAMGKRQMDRAIEQQTARLERLKRQRDELTKTFSPASGGIPGEDIPFDQGSPLLEAQQAEAARQKKLLEDMDRIAKEAQRVYDEALAWGTAFDAATARAKFLEEELKKIAKTAPELTKGLAGGSGKYAAPAAIGERIRFHAAQQGLDPILMEALIGHESNFGPRRVSPAGAKGLMQIMPSNYAKYGITDPFDIEQNLSGGMKLFRHLLDVFNNDVKLALAAWNAGEGAVKNYKNTIPPYKETQGLVSDVLKRQAALQGTGSAPNTPAQLRYADLVAQQKDAQRIATEGKTIAKTMDDADKARTDTIEKQGEALDRLIEKLKDKTKVLSEEEIAQIRVNLARIKDFDVTKARIETLLNEANARREVVAALEREVVEQERLGEVRKKVDDAYKKALKEQAQIDEDYAKRKMEWQREISQNALAAAQEERRAREATQQEIGALLLDTGRGVIGAIRDPGTGDLNAARLERTMLQKERARIEAQGKDTNQIDAQIRALDRQIDALKRAGNAWTELGEKVADALLKMAIQKSGFEQKIGDLALQGINWVMKLFSAASGAPSLDTPTADIPTAIDFDALRASGGPVTAGKPYIVGERGPELVVPQSSGMVISNEAIRNAYTSGGNRIANDYGTYGGTSAMYNSSVTHGDRPVTFVMNLNGVSDAQSFQKSRAEIQRGMVQMWQSAQRSA